VTHRVMKGKAPLEVLVGVTIIFLAMAVLYAGYRLGVRSWESGERTRAAISELRQAGSVVRTYVPQSIPFAIRNSNVWQSWFEGDARRLVFITSIPASLGPGGTYEMTLQVGEGKNGAALMLSRRLLHPDAVPGAPGVGHQPRMLVGALDSATFSYFGATKDKGDESWHTSWVGRQRLPRLVRLRLVSRLVGVWPDIVVRLPVDDNGIQRPVAFRELSP
jgi:general secretion pathway protein J